MVKAKRKRPDVLIPQFSRAITHNSKNIHTARQWVNKGWLEFIPGHPMLIRRELAVQVLSAWRSSCTPAEFAELIGATKSWVRHAVDKKRLQTINVLVFKRILRSEELKAKALLEVSQRDVMFPGKKGWARYSSAKRRELAFKAREVAVALGRTGGISTPEARKACSERWKQFHAEGRIPYMNGEQAREIGKKGGQVAQENGNAHYFTDADRQKGLRNRWGARSGSKNPGRLRRYQPRKAGDREAIGTKRLVTVEQAGRILGIFPRQLEASPDFRIIYVGGKVLLFANQVEAARRRQEIKTSRR